LIALIPRLRRFAFGLSGSIDEADDLVQAGVERAIQNLERWRPGTRLDSWLYRIVQNLHRNRLRGDRVRDQYRTTVGQIADQSIDGSRVVEANMALRVVRNALQELPEPQRTVLLLISVEGFSYAETAEFLDIPVGTVTSRLARARAKLIATVDGEPLQTGDGDGAVEANQ